MRLITVALVLVIALMQYKLWFANGSVSDVMHLKASLESQLEKNNQLKQRNSVLEAEINNIKSGKHALEERARQDLGMVREGETFYQLVEVPSDKVHRE